MRIASCREIIEIFREYYRSFIDYMLKVVRSCLPEDRVVRGPSLLSIKYVFRQIFENFIVCHTVVFFTLGQNDGTLQGNDVIGRTITLQSFAQRSYTAERNKKTKYCGPSEHKVQW